MKNPAEYLRDEGRFLAALFLSALALRLAYALSLPPDRLSPDAGDWMSVGWNIAQGLGWGGTWRPPGYSAFLGLMFFLFGKSVAAVRAAQALLGAATCLITYRTGRELLDETTGRLAGAMAAFYPYFIAYTGDLISETFLTFMIALAVYRLVLASKEPTWRNMAAAGVTIGLAGLTKSTVLPFFLLGCFWLWWRAGLRAAFLTGVFVLLAITPWTIRNSLYYRGYAMPVSTPWYSFYGSSSTAAVQLELMGEQDTAQITQVTPPDWERISAMPVPERDKYCREKALQWIRENPDTYRYLIYRRFVHFWRLWPMMAYRWQKYLAAATSGIYIPLALLGFALAWREFGRTSLLAAIFAGYTAVHLFFVVTLRYRVPIDTFVIIMAACALSRLTRPRAALPTANKV